MAGGDGDSVVCVPVLFIVSLFDVLLTNSIAFAHQ